MGSQNKSGFQRWKTGFPFRRGRNQASERRTQKLAISEVKSEATRRFWKCFDALPKEILDLAEKNYLFWQQDLQHPSLHFKKLQGSGNRFSVRVGIGYRAIG